jgi:hypothetical protein
MVFMKSSSVFERRSLPAVVFVILFFLCIVPSFAKETWFNERVTWKYGKEGLAWKTAIKNPNGDGEYRLMLQPLWALEGGVLALEILVARPQQPDINILGERENGIEYPFVITVKELEKGLAQSKFGAVRTLHAGDIALNVKIERFRLGKGVGSGSTYCSKCNNLQELSMWITVESRESAITPGKRHSR